MFVCGINVSNNTCVHLDKKKGICRSKVQGCSFRWENSKELGVNRNTYVRKPRWYEKYYK